VSATTFAAQPGGCPAPGLAGDKNLVHVEVDDPLGLEAECLKARVLSVPPMHDSAMTLPRSPTAMWRKRTTTAG
jgi:hypothetical protein